MEVTIADRQQLSKRKKIGKILEEKGGGFCPIHDFLIHFANKWSMLVILNLGYSGKARFNALKQSTSGISQRMLTVTLRSLEEDGLISRTVFPEIPPRVEYELTSLGKSLLDVMTMMGEWATRHEDEIQHARKAFRKAH
ncbi:helix-turn-helix domain-containing protein [Chryseolinea sp. T2]|uniref:winged helix-turn-helix transcriptional regulator n=1 Tax=Chryseolinea sp. T2 TaxID=3129255 RepID=UPI003076BC7C